MDITCPYCNSSAIQVTGREIYPQRSDLYSRAFWCCSNGHPPAYVGCHPGTNRPLGTLADGLLREIRSQTHVLYDRLWQEQHFTRSQCYALLSAHLKLPLDQTHIAMFDAAQCRSTMRFARDILAHLETLT